jgi:ribosomal protein S18 acetylase RimI-like enzyme
VGKVLAPSDTPIRSYRLATEQDLPEIARIHIIAYSRNHFTTRLPEHVLQRYYRYFLQGGTQISLALSISCAEAVQKEVIDGFAVYGVGIPDKIALFKKECLRHILIASLKNPLAASWKALKAALNSVAKKPPFPPANFLLLSIAVAPQSRGVGKHLLASMLEVAGQNFHNSAGLYVNADNVRAINAYFSAGFDLKYFSGGQYYMERSLG